MELHELGTIFTVMSFVPDGKIDTINFAYPVESSFSGRIVHMSPECYGIDYDYREFYRPIEEHVDTRFIDLVDDWFREETEIRGYRRNK